MPHFFAPSHDGQVTIVGDDARHLTQSLRSRPGQTISVIDPAGRIIEVRLTKVGTEQVVGEVISDSPYNPEPAMAATVALAMLPASALEDALSHCTELGAFEFILVETQRSV
ncbi:MAG TPA: RNA methyltransferase PUA domain-containing protein, partial [Candidatus Dormibacteraeota bacterium]|nr:RNA methyltransferase PUA domain-containing protein [Candidatus Dormibacteraeota bacterium]